MGRKLSAETIEKIRQKAMGHKRNVGRKLTQQHKDNIARAHVAMRHSPETLIKLRKLADARRGKSLATDVIARMRQQKAALVTCPYCGKEGKAGGMQRHHFEHCKHRPCAHQPVETEVDRAA